MTVQDAVGLVALLRGQLALFRSLLALSVAIASSRDETEILRVVTTAVPSLGGCRVEAVYLDGAWHVGGPVGHPADGEALAAQLVQLDRSGGSLRIDGAGWVWGYPLVGLDDRAGHLVVSCENEPAADHQFLLDVLVQQTGLRWPTPACTPKSRPAPRKSETSPGGNATLLMRCALPTSRWSKR